MPKKKVHLRNSRHAKKSKRRNRRKNALIASLILSLSLAGILIARWRGVPLVGNPLATSLQPSQTPSLSKEYIYAGGKLVAIEESTVGSGPAPTNLLATATSATAVSLTWTAPTGSISHYLVERSQSVNEPYIALTPNPTTTSFTDSTATSDTAYLYRVRAVYTNGGYSEHSNRDLATTVVFTDNPLVPSVTPIRASHMRELRRAVNAVRTLAGLPPASWTYPDPVSEPAEQRRNIYLEDVTDLRTKLDEALTILERVQPYDPNPPLSSGSLISAEHFTQIRERVK
jgi:Fibronectin type III domain